MLAYPTLSFYFEDFFFALFSDGSCKKFEATCATDLISINSLDVGLKYPILLAARVKTRYGPRIVLTLRDDEEAGIAKVFLPARYYSLFSDSDIDAINSQTVQYYFVYRGLNEKTRTLNIVITKEGP
jgi:hypothetical protein